MKRNSKTPQKDRNKPKKPTKGRRAVSWNIGTRVEQPKKGRKSYNRRKNTLFPDDEEGGFGVNW